MRNDHMAPMDLAVKIFSENVGSVAGLEVLPRTQHHVFLITGGIPLKRYVLKIYDRRHGLVENSEPLIYQLLQGSPFIRRCVSSSNERGAGRGFVILEYLEGETLLKRFEDLKKRPGSVKNIADQIAAYVSACRAIQISGFGELSHDLSELKGTAESWTGFLEDYFERASLEVGKLPEGDGRSLLSSTLGVLARFLRGERGYFDNVPSALVPIDLNLSNFLVTSDERVIVLDLEAFWAADPLLAEGEWVGHTYATRFHTYGCKSGGCLPASYRRRVVRFYALLSNFDVLLFVLRNDLGNVTEARPWGNEITFQELLRIHSAALAFDSLTAEAILEANSILEDDWGFKTGTEGSTRTVTVNTTLERLKDVGGLAGITRVADVTDLDSMGIPVYQSVRPDAEEDTDTFTVFSGKGLSKEQCQVSAIAEAIERYCAEKGNFNEDKVIVGNYENLAKQHLVIHPSEFNMPADARFSEKEPLEWVSAIDVTTGTEHYVTANTVFYPYFPSTGRMLFRYFTTGLGAGNSYLEALAHGLAEVIERDAAALNRILRNNPAVDSETIESSPACSIIAKARSANLNVIVRQITSPDMNVPAFFVIFEDQGMMDPLYVSGGYGAHPDKEIALIHALNEAALSRVGTISGAREDLKKFQQKQKLNYREYKSKYAYWFDDTSRVVNYRTIPTYQFSTVLEDFVYMCNAVKSAGFEQVLMIDLSRAEFPIRVVKVQVPGVERYSFKMQCVGNRAKERFKAMYGTELV